MAKTAIQATLDEIKKPLELLEDTKAETKIVIDDSVMGIETLLNMMSITLQDERESNQENPNGLRDSTTPPLDKGKAKISTLQDLEFKNFIKTPIRTAKVYKTFFMTKLRLPRKD